MHVCCHASTMNERVAVVYAPHMCAYVYVYSEWAQSRAPAASERDRVWARMSAHVRVLYEREVSVSETTNKWFAHTSVWLASTVYTNPASIRAWYHPYLHVGTRTCKFHSKAFWDALYVCTTSYLNVACILHILSSKTTSQSLSYSYMHVHCICIFILCIHVYIITWIIHQTMGQPGGTSYCTRN